MKKIKKRSLSIFTIIILVVAALILIGAGVIRLTNWCPTAPAEKTEVTVIKSINKYIQLDLDQKRIDKHSSMHEAVAVPKQYGFLPDNMTTKANYNLGWDSQSGKFVFLEINEGNAFAHYYEGKASKTYSIDLTNSGSKDRNAADFFIATLYENYNPLSYFSTYACGKDWEDEITCYTGFDTGFVTNIKTITYDSILYNLEKVLINTTNKETKVNMRQATGMVIHCNTDINEPAEIKSYTRNKRIYQIEQGLNKSEVYLTISFNSSIYNENNKCISNISTSLTVRPDLIYKSEGSFLCSSHGSCFDEIHIEEKYYKVCYNCGQLIEDNLESGE